MTSIALFELLMLLGAAAVVCLGVWLARTGLRFRAWHGALGMVGSLWAVSAIPDSELPPNMVYAGMGAAVLGCAASAGVFYAARRQRYVDAAAAAVTPRGNSHTEPISGWFLSHKTSSWRWDVEYAVLVGRRRLVAARVGGQHSGEESPAGFGLLGKVVSAELRAVERRRHAALERALGSVEVDLDALLAHHRANFQLQFSLLGRARLVPRSKVEQVFRPGPATLVLEPTGAPEVRLLLRTSADVRRCQEAFAATPLAFEVDAALLTTAPGAR